MKDRILQIIKRENLTNAEFAEKIGISTSSLSHILNERNKPSLEVVMRIHKSCPYVNLEWLLYGEGDMMATGDDAAGNGSLPKADENVENVDTNAVRFDFCKEKASGYTDFIPEKFRQEEVRYIEKPQPKIVEIRIFFDNGTYQTFRPAE